MFAILLVVFSAFRITLFFHYRAAFSELHANAVAFAFLDGLRFDVATLVLVAGLPVFLLCLPVSRRWWISTWAVTTALLGILCVILLTADFLYFGASGRHVGDELRTCWGDTGFLITMSIKYWPLLLALSFAMVALPWCIIRSVNRLFRRAPATTTRIALTVVLVLPALVQGYRGVILGKPLGLIDAFSRGSSAYGNLVLNGVFSSVHTSRKASSARHEAISPETAIATASSAVVCPWETVPAPANPLQRQIRHGDLTTRSNRLNVVLVILESFGREYIEMSGHRGYNISPNLDCLATNGVLFTHCYANGQRSIHGLAAVLLSIPPVQGLPYLGGGLEVARVHRAGSTLLRHGYRTIGAQSGPRRSYRTDGIAAALGFEEYAGMEDEPRRQKVAAKRPLPPFGWDYDVLMHLLVMLDAKTGPFLAFAITGTPHTPYRVPDERFEKYPHADQGLNGFLNALFYSDWAVGEFMNEARKRPWFNDTVFIFTADHALDASNRGSNPDARFGIPLLIFAPRLFAPRVDETVSSQADIWPTIVDLLGFEDSYAGIGRSLLRDAPGRFALMSEGSNVIIVTPNGWMRHSRQRRLETVLLPGAAEDEADRLEKLALSLDQAVFSLLKGNRFFDE